jgi:ubiquinol-cytochrome c reductase iron-sulfur subunit
MSDDKDEREDSPRTAADASGSVFKRAQHPVSTGGEERERGRSASAREIEGEVLQRGNMASDVPDAARPRRKVGRRQQMTPEAAAAAEAHLSRPGDDEGTQMLPGSQYGGDGGLDPREDAFAEKQVAFLFLLGILGTLATCVLFFVIDSRANLGRDMNYALGGCLALALLSVGAGFVLWAKKLLPHDKAVQDRGTFHSPEEEELLAEETFFKGFASTQLGSRKILRRTVLGALALLPLPAVVLLRDLGPLPRKQLRKSGWSPHIRLVDVETKLPIKLGDLEIGGIKTVMPDGFGSSEEHALAPTMLIRFAPGEIRSKKERSWSKHDHVAYSKICTHAGCPISLYEQQSHHLLCPCHQSTFDMANDANVIFGPAARRLPQLRLDVDAEGYFVAASDYAEPVGPSFWERG